MGLSCILAAHYLWFLLALPSTTRLLACFPALCRPRAPAEPPPKQAEVSAERTRTCDRMERLVSPHRTAAPTSQPAAALLAAAAPAAAATAAAAPATSAAQVTFGLRSTAEESSEELTWSN